MHTYSLDHPVAYPTDPTSCAIKYHVGLRGVVVVLEPPRVLHLLSNVSEFFTTAFADQSEYKDLLVYPYIAYNLTMSLYVSSIVFYVATGSTGQEDELEGSPHLSSSATRQARHNSVKRHASARQLLTKLRESQSVTDMNTLQRSWNVSTSEFFRVVHFVTLIQNFHRAQVVRRAAALKTRSLIYGWVFKREDTLVFFRWDRLYCFLESPEMDENSSRGMDMRLGFYQHGATSRCFANVLIRDISHVALQPPEVDGPFGKASQATRRKSIGTSEALDDLDTDTTSPSSSFVIVLRLERDSESLQGSKHPHHTGASGHEEIVLAMRYDRDASRWFNAIVSARQELKLDQASLSQLHHPRDPPLPSSTSSLPRQPILTKSLHALGFSNVYEPEMKKTSNPNTTNSTMSQNSISEWMSLTVTDLTCFCPIRMTEQVEAMACTFDATATGASLWDYRHEKSKDHLTSDTEAPLSHGILSIGDSYLDLRGGKLETVRVSFEQASKNTPTAHHTNLVTNNVSGFDSPLPATGGVSGASRTSHRDLIHS